MTPAALRHLINLGLSLGVGSLLGWLSGQLAWALVLSMLPWLVWYLYQTLQLDLWLRQTRRHPPRTMGLWRAVFDRLFRMQKQTEKEINILRTGLDEFRTATNTFPEPVMLVDAHHVLLWYNDAAVAQLGLRPSSDRGQVVQNLIRQPDFTDWLHDSNDAAQVEVTSPIQEDTIFQVNRSPMESGRVLLIFRDITELHAVETMRRDFVANVSHELRTPLTVLMGYLETLDYDANPELAMILDRMRGQTHLMQSLIDDLIEISRLQTQHIEGREEHVEMHALLYQLKEQAESLSDGRHLITFDIASDAGLFGASKDLESAFTNLITNAVRYTPDGGTIELRWALTERGGELSVTDSGIGIPSKDIPRLTERFYRVAKDRSRSSGGSGLGLSIVKHVLNAHDAELEITSQVGDGSTFSCIFPNSRLIDEHRQSPTSGSNAS